MVKEDQAFSKIDLQELKGADSGKKARRDICEEEFDETKQRPRENSSSARWYFDEEDLILNHDIGDFPRAVLVIVTVRLGLSGIDPDYF